MSHERSQKDGCLSLLEVPGRSWLLEALRAEGWRVEEEVSDGWHVCRGRKDGLHLIGSGATRGASLVDLVQLVVACGRPTICSE
jgi:hypothetical protein